MVINEFVAFGQLGPMKGTLDPRTFAIATFALCGFANFSSIGIQIGGIGALAPEQRSQLAKIRHPRMLAGTMANLMSAALPARSYSPASELFAGVANRIFGAKPFFERGLGAFLAPRKNPTMEADIKFAIVPASMARMPNFASWLRCFRCERADATDLDAIELKLAKPQRAKWRLQKCADRACPSLGPSCPKATNSLITHGASRGGCQSSLRHARARRSARQRARTSSRKRSANFPGTRPCEASCECRP